MPQASPERTANWTRLTRSVERARTAWKALLMDMVPGELLGELPVARPDVPPDTPLSLARPAAVLRVEVESGTTEGKCSSVKGVRARKGKKVGRCKSCTWL